MRGLQAEIAKSAVQVFSHEASTDWLSQGSWEHLAERDTASARLHALLRAIAVCQCCMQPPASAMLPSKSSGWPHSVSTLFVLRGAGGHSASCESCSPNQVSTAGRDGCSCRAGWGLGADNQCRVCPIGFWASPHGGDEDYGRGGDMLRPCTHCSELFSDGMATTLAEGASSPSQCVCQVNVAGICVAAAYLPEILRCLHARFSVHASSSFCTPQTYALCAALLPTFHSRGTEESTAPSAR